ncbi:MAG: aspartate kinase [Acidobacteria bacterium]|jgi:aspartate kinase|nr:aspartate kinase [Acidobacteriota bacterium]
MIRVMKFGGGCLRDGRSIAQACAIIAAQKKAVVVVSAVSGVTELLLGAIVQAKRHEKNIPPILAALAAKHFGVIAELCPNGPVKRRLQAAIASQISQVERLLTGIACHRDLTPAVRARLLSHGERLAARLLAGVMESLETESAAMDAHRAGICTDDNCENASIDRERTRKAMRAKVAPLLRRDIVPVIPGFFGRGPGGGITLLGRNGSDYSAAAVAYALGAERLEVWKDVDGFMSADPSRVPTARRLERLSFAEAAELSYFGAKILHPRTVEPLAGTKIRVFVRNMKDPAGAGSEIVAAPPSRGPEVAGIAANTRLAIIRVHGAGIGSRPGLLANVSSLLAAGGINIHSVLTSQTCINLLLDPADARRGLIKVKAAANGVIRKVELEERLALVGVVGERIMEKEGIYARIFSAVAREKINVEMAAAGASPVACYFLVRCTDLDRAVRAVHDEFFP